MKEQILKLKAEGKSQAQIARELGLSRSGVSYHYTEGQKDKYLERQRNRRAKGRNPLGLKRERLSGLSNQKVHRNASRMKERGYKVTSIHSKKRFILNPTWTVQDMADKIGQNPICYLTGDSIDINNGKSYHLDHIVPTSKGGTSDINNMNIASRNANLAKSDMLLPEFLELCEKVLRHHGYIIQKP